MGRRTKSTGEWNRKLGIYGSKFLAFRGIRNCTVYEKKGFNPAEFFVFFVYRISYFGGEIHMTGTHRRRHGEKDTEGKIQRDRDRGKET